MSFELNEFEVRTLGCLVEKQLTTPDYYPLTINALMNACNQKSNREPVVNYDEQTIEQALQTLSEKNLAYPLYGGSSRVAKYKHMIPSIYDLGPAEVAVMTVLMLRGAQTVGEMNQRTTRLFEFSDLEEVHTTVDGLVGRDEPLVFKLERQPGQKEARYVHLLSGQIDMDNFSFPASSSGSSRSNERLEQMEKEIEQLRADFGSLKQDFEEFKTQFE